MELPSVEKSKTEQLFIKKHAKSKQFNRILHKEFRQDLISKRKSVTTLKFYQSKAEQSVTKCKALKRTYQKNFSQVLISTFFKMKSPPIELKFSNFNTF